MIRTRPSVAPDQARDAMSGLGAGQVGLRLEHRAQLMKLAAF
jgi:hypothetical protein